MVTPRSLTDEDAYAGTDLNQWMVDGGWAAVYYGTGPKPVPA